MELAKILKENLVSFLKMFFLKLRVVIKFIKKLRYSYEKN